MNKDQARQLGRIAFAEDRKAVPFADPAIVAEMADAKVGDKVHILTAWTQGWHEANLAADDNGYPACPKCGDPIDYCQGHGELG